MRAPTQPLDLDLTARGTFLRLGWLWVVIPLLLIAAAVGWSLLRYTQAGRQTQSTGVTQASGEKPPWLLNGGYDKYPVEKRAVVAEEDPNAKALAELQRQLAEQQQHDQARQRELDELKRRLAAQPKPAAQTAGPPPKTEKRMPMLYVVNAKIPQQPPTYERTYTLPVWSYLPCVLESLLNSEIPGHFTVRITRPVMDATGAVVLIPQGQRVGAKANSGELLFGNERIPTFALSLQQKDGTALELGEAPIMDAAGTNGLTGEVHNHVWRLIWTSIFLGGLQAGQQMLQTEMGAEFGRAAAASIAQQGNQAARMRLGRAQDTRPTIRVFAGESCQILTPKAWSLPAAS